MASATPLLRFSGHETFVCRYAWLPKAIRAVSRDSTILTRPDDAMVELGVGKNMAISIKFWAESSQVIAALPTSGHEVTALGNGLLKEKDGHDPYLENTRTLWLLHWKIATNREAPVFLWRQMLNFWHRAEFSESQVLPFLEQAAAAYTKLRSKRTLSDGLRVFVNSYVPTRSSKGDVAEENLDSPLVELELIHRTGDRHTTDGAHRETIFAFNIEDKPAITPELFAYCLNDYWSNEFPSETTLPFERISSAPGSPGQVFKLPEIAVRRHLDLLSEVTGGAYAFEESALLQHVIRHESPTASSLLDAIYATEVGA